MNKRKEAIEILQRYADSLKEKGVKIPEIKQDKQLAILAIGWLEDEFKNEEIDRTSHLRNSTCNIPAFDKRFIAAQFIIQEETRKDDDFTRKTSYHAYYYGGKKIAASSNIKELVKCLKVKFKGKYSVSQYSIVNAIQKGELNFDWGYLEIHRKDEESEF